jgi:photosystem II stability/assembly factor-like uncharacterized protein
MKNSLIKVTILYATFLINCLAQQTGWEVVQSGTNKNLNSIFFFDLQFGFACGDSGVVLKSLDSGKTWQSLPSPLTTNLNDCYMFDQNCFMAVGDSGNVIDTYDGGNTWYTWLTNGRTEDIYCVSFSEYQGNFYSIFGRDSLMIWYGVSNYCSTVIVEEFGGYETGGFMGAQIFTYDKVFIVGENSSAQVVFGKTTTDIYTWNFKSFYLDGKEARATGVTFFDSFVGFISSILWDGGGAISKTLDNGDNWATKFFKQPLHSISIPLSGTSQVGYCVGDSGTILKTTNAGENWYNQISPTSERLNKVYFLDQNCGFAVGDNGTILRTTDGGVTHVDGNKNNDLPTEFLLYQNYPNPFNPTTKISWQSPVGSWQTLKIYDLLGNEIATLVDEEKPAGKYEVEFNASNLPSGVYFYRLQAGSFNKIKKMILIK